jgi:hypothetical protein
VGEIVARQAGKLEVGNLVKQPTIFRSQRQKLADTNIHSAAVNKCRLSLVVAGVVPDADERIIQRIGRTEEEPTDSGKPVRTHSAPGRRADHGFSCELMDVGIYVGLTKDGIKILLRIAGVTVIALNGKP